MKQHVTVVPSDRLIIVGGIPLQLDFSAPENMHALQQHEGSGHIEWTDDINHPLTPADYAEDVAPFVALWEAEKARLEEEAAAAEVARLVRYSSEEAKAERIREERDRRIAETDYLVATDYPLAADKMKSLKAYRQALRDLPQQEGFPWSGEVDDPTIPWPVLNFSQ